jgi:hypothetical protein
MHNLWCFDGVREFQRLITQIFKTVNSITVNSITVFISYFSQIYNTPSSPF